MARSSATTARALEPLPTRRTAEASDPDPEPPRGGFFHRLHQSALKELVDASVLADVRKVPRSSVQCPPSLFKQWETGHGDFRADDVLNTTLRLTTVGGNDLEIPHFATPTVLFLWYNEFGASMARRWESVLYDVEGTDASEAIEPEWEGHVAVPPLFGPPRDFPHDRLALARLSVNERNWSFLLNLSKYLDKATPNEFLKSRTISLTSRTFRNDTASRALRASNRATGYVFVIDARGGIRFWGSGTPSAEEAQKFRDFISSII